MISRGRRQKVWTSFMFQTRMLWRTMRHLLVCCQVMRVWFTPYGQMMDMRRLETDPSTFLVWLVCTCASRPRNLCGWVNAPTILFCLWWHLQSFKDNVKWRWSDCSLSCSQRQASHGWLSSHCRISGVWSSYIYPLHFLCLHIALWTLHACY